MRYRRWSTISLGGANGAAGGRKKTGGGEGGHGSVVGLMTVDTLDEHSVARDEGGRRMRGSSGKSYSFKWSR